MINLAGLDLIKQFEGCSLTAYQDMSGVWTIGYGHTQGVQPGMVISQAEADQTLLDDLRTTEFAVTGAVAGAATNDNQFAAMVSLTYNIGVEGFSGSTVLKDHRAGAYTLAANAFLMWDEVNGQVVEGLTRRRKAERQLYLA